MNPEVDLDYYHKEYLSSDKSDFLICSCCEQKEKQKNCFKLLEYIRSPADDFSIYHSKYIGGIPYICGSMRKISESDKYLELLENCFGKLT